MKNKRIQSFAVCLLVALSVLATACSAGDGAGESTPDNALDGTIVIDHDSSDESGEDTFADTLDPDGSDTIVIDDGSADTDAAASEEADSSAEADTEGETMPNGTTETGGLDEVVILYTNDIHAFLNNDKNETPGLTYAHLSQMKKDLGDKTLLVDAGDHVQGSVYGAMDEGASVLKIMDTMYDLSAIGNHEFDYGMDRMLALTAGAAYPYISCNFVHKESGETVLKAHVIKEVGNVKIGFVGVTTPETLTGTAPAYFQNEQGEYIYDFLNGEALYAAVQASVDALRAEGADYVIALGHMGVDAASATTSRTVISHVSGLDAFIDGHSHTEMASEMVKDKTEKDVLLTQTGYYFGGVGKMTIGSDGRITAEIIKSYDKMDETIQTMKDEWVADVDARLGEKIGVLQNTLYTHDEAGERLVRVKSTNLGDFVADSYYYYVNTIAGLSCDVTIINGGGLRTEIAAGDVSYLSLKATNPFGNMLCAVEMSGQEIRDLLEWCSRATTGVAGENEEGSFLHTAGLTYKVDAAVIGTVQEDGNGVWTGAPTGEYRVYDIKVYDKASGTYVDLDLEKTYVVAGTNYTLVNGGGGCTMIQGALVKDYIVEDYMALAAYAKAFVDTDKDGYADITTANSPLAAYTGFLMNYEDRLGAERAQVIARL